MSNYVATHRRIPDPLAASLTRCGVHEWTIWSDNSSDLIHFVHSDAGIAAVERRMTAGNHKMPEWDELISSLVDGIHGSEPLTSVWKLHHGEQA
jgi:L-rhamnose mutarotase